MTDKEFKEYDIEGFQTYVRNHVILVNRIAKIVFNTEFLVHDSDKLDEDAPDWYLIAFGKRRQFFNKERKLSDEEKKEISKAVYTHVKINGHHAESWDDSIKEEIFDFENYPTVDCSKMPLDYFTEMCCDWSAVALSKNEPLIKFFNNNVGKGKRYIFTKEQEELIVENLKKIAKEVDKFDIHFMDVDYTKTNSDLKEYLFKLNTLKFKEEGECCGGGEGISGGNAMNASSGVSSYAPEKINKIISLSSD